LKAKIGGRIEFEELRTVVKKDAEGNNVDVVIGRSGEMKIVDVNTGIVLTTSNIPYGSHLVAKNGKVLEKGDVICRWDPYNAVILSEINGIIEFDAIEEGATFREEVDEQTGFREKVITESRDKKKNPAIKVLDAKTKEEVKFITYLLVRISS
jgi:DNA-directed RNA polymerase subunit beta'